MSEPAHSETGTLYCYNSLALNILTRNPASTDFTPAVIIADEIVTNNGRSGPPVSLSVQTTESLSRAVVLYRYADETRWHSAEMGVGGASASVTLPASRSGTMVYIVQVVDQAGSLTGDLDRGSPYRITLERGTQILIPAMLKP